MTELYCIWCSVCDSGKDIVENPSEVDAECPDCHTTMSQQRKEVVSACACCYEPWSDTHECAMLDELLNQISKDIKETISAYDFSVSEDGGINEEEVYYYDKNADCMLANKKKVDAYLTRIQDEFDELMPNEDWKIELEFRDDDYARVRIYLLYVPEIESEGEDE